VLIPPIPDGLAKRLRSSSDIASNPIHGSIKSLNDFIKLLPAKYGWRFRTVDALKAELLENSRVDGAAGSQPTLLARHAQDL
jgi:hypothetical protein